VRSDQFQTYLADPDADGRSRTVYDYETVAFEPRPAVPGSTGGAGGGGSDALLVALAALGALVVAGGGLVAWAHS